MIPIDVGVESDRRRLYDDNNADRRLMELDLIEEAWDKAATRLILYHQRMRQDYNKRVIPRFF